MTEVTASSKDISITWSCQPVAGKGLSLHYLIKNIAQTDVYVLDRLWTMNGASHATVDEQLVYRFVKNGALRLLLGAAPLTRPAFYRNVPDATHIAPGATQQRTIMLPEPIKEYSCYFSETDPKNFENAPVDKVVLLLEYVVASPGVKVRPSVADPAAMTLLGSWAPAMLASEAHVASLRILRRTDRFDRVALPGEPQEPRP